MGYHRWLAGGAGAHERTLEPGGVYESRGRILSDLLTIVIAWPGKINLGKVYDDRVCTKRI